AFIIFGLTLGSFSFNEQLWAAPLKILMGVIISAVICLPSLYIFTALTRTSLKLPEIAQGLAAALALIAALLRLPRPRRLANRRRLRLLAQLLPRTGRFDTHCYKEEMPYLTDENSVATEKIGLNGRPLLKR
ncbi:MAG: hypothetical protein QNL24_09015, partial [Akkermansiaceae bacterium]